MILFESQLFWSPAKCILGIEKSSYEEDGTKKNGRYDWVIGERNGWQVSFLQQTQQTMKFEFVVRWISSGTNPFKSRIVTSDQNCNQSSR